MWSILTGGRTGAEWVAEYEKGHIHPLNQACHAFGIPMIAASVPMFVAAYVAGRFWRVPATLFTVGWGLQFMGHAFEGKPPEFLRDPRFLFVGLRWWISKMLGKS